MTWIGSQERPSSRVLHLVQTYEALPGLVACLAAVGLWGCKHVMTRRITRIDLP